MEAARGIAGVVKVRASVPKRIQRAGAADWWKGDTFGCTVGMVGVLGGGFGKARSSTSRLLGTTGEAFTSVFGRGSPGPLMESLGKGVYGKMGGFLGKGSTVLAGAAFLRSWFR